MCTFRLCSIGINCNWWVGLVGFFHVLLRKKPFLVGLLDQLRQPASNQVQMVERASLGVTAFQPKMVGKVLY